MCLMNKWNYEMAISKCVWASTCHSSVLTAATAPPSASQWYWLLIQSVLSWLNKTHFSPWGVCLHALCVEKRNKMEVMKWVCFHLQAPNDPACENISYDHFMALHAWKLKSLSMLSKYAENITEIFFYQFCFD